LKKVEQKLNTLGMEDIWRRGGENNNNAWREVSKSCADTEHQKMEGKRSLALYNELKSNWERENCVEVCTFEERRGIGWLKMGS
jgi:hypothetical protein